MHPAFKEMKESRESKLNSMVGSDAHHEHPTEKASRISRADGGGLGDQQQTQAPSGMEQEYNNFTKSVSDQDAANRRMDDLARSTGYGQRDYAGNAAVNAPRKSGGRIKRADGGPVGSGSVDDQNGSFNSGKTIGNYASGDEYQAGDTKHYIKKYGTDVSKWPYQNPDNRKMVGDRSKGGSVKRADGGTVLQLPTPTDSTIPAKQILNEQAAKQGGVGYSPKNVDFGLLDKLRK